MTLVCPFSNCLIAKAKSLISSDRISIEVFSVRFGLCVRMIWCLFDQFFIHHIDRKYRSATALLVPLLLGSTSFHHQLKAYACTKNYKNFWPWKQKQNRWDTTDKHRTFAFFARIFCYEHVCKYEWLKWKPWSHFFHFAWHRTIFKKLEFPLFVNLLLPKE